jgi:alpha-tubulin suppressor-like RCC1 family protein
MRSLGLGRLGMQRGTGAQLLAVTLFALCVALAWVTSATAEEAGTLPVNVHAPTVTPEDAVEGSTLTAHAGTWEGSPAPSYSYQWLSCSTLGEGCTVISGATGSTFVPSASQLGRAVEVEVTATNTAGSATAASNHTSEVRAIGGQVVSWGSNRVGQLDSGYRDTFETKPVDALGLANVIGLAAGAEFALALLNNGTVRSWGRNGKGQAGDGVNGEHPLENNVAVVGLTHAKAIAASNDHAMALLEDGEVDVWGASYFGELGNGLDEEAEKPNKEVRHVCGLALKSKELLPKERLPRAEPHEPVAVPGLTGVVAIAAGGGSDYALLKNGEVMAWGQNGHGQLGIGETGPNECYGFIGKKETSASVTPRKVVTAVLNEKGEPVKNERGETELTPLTGVASISAGEETAYAVLDDGHVMAWGGDPDGQLGSGQREPEHVNTTAVEVKRASTGKGLEDVASVTGANTDALALLKTGEVLGWGAAGPQLGEMEDVEECKHLKCIKTARPIPGLEHLDATAISSGEGYNLVVSAGKIYGLGLGEHGELGDGHEVNTKTPTAIEGLGAVSTVQAGLGNTGKYHITEALGLLASGVTPPAPLMTLEPGVESLHAAWTLEDPEYEVEYKRFGAGESACEAGEEHSEEGVEEEGEEGAGGGEGTGEGGEECAKSGEEKESEEGEGEESKGEWLGIYHLREKEKGAKGKEEVKVWHGFTFGLGGETPQGEKLPALEAEQSYQVIVKSLRSATSQKTGKPIKVLERKRTMFGTPLA